MITDSNEPKNFAGRKIHHPILNPREDYESWHFSIKTQNREIIKVKFSINENHDIPVKSSAAVWIIDENFNEIEEKIIIESKISTFDTENCNIKIKDNWCINRGDFYEIYVKINGNGIHAKLWPYYSNWEPAEDGVIHTNLLGTQYFGMNFPIVHSKVDGVLFKDNKQIDIKGTASLDHIWGNDSLQKSLSYLHLGNFFFDDSFWLYYIALDKDKKLMASVLGIDNDGIKYNLEKNFNQNEINVKLLDISNKREIFNNFPQLIKLSSLDNHLELKINIGDRISKDLFVGSRLKANKAADFITDIELTIKENNLRKTYRTVSVSEFHSFVD